jgi:uncharacterized protein YqgC (DUF456 family)
MDVLLYALGALVLLAGLAGVVLPGIPGAPLLFVGALLVAWAGGFQRVGWGTVTVAGALAALIAALDFVAAALGGKAFGASRWAMVGGSLGLLVGLAFGLPGILLGPAVGAFALEWLRDRDLHRSFRAGLGTAAGFLAGSAAKVVLALVLVGAVVLALAK